MEKNREPSHKKLTNKERITALEYLDKGYSAQQVGNILGVSSTAIYNVRNNASKYLALPEAEGETKKNTDPKLRQLEERLFDVIENMRQINKLICIDNQWISTQALKLGESLELPDFKASINWLQGLWNIIVVCGISIDNCFELF